MPTQVEIRGSVADDQAVIESLYARAFPDEDLLPLVRNLLRDEEVVTSLVGIVRSSVAGHVAFTRCSVNGHDGAVSLLGPVAVEPGRQRQGVGSAMIRAGLEHMRDSGIGQVFVLGDPTYYGRLGFAPESRVMPPYSLPPEWRGAWQSRCLAASAAAAGKLAVPNPWRQRRLWVP